MSTALTQLLTPLEVATWLTVTTPDVLRMTHAGNLPCVRLPDGEPRYEPAELEQWLHRRRARMQDHFGGPDRAVQSDH